MVRAARPDLEVVPQRGNVNTRLSHVLEGDLDACLLARAGLERLGLSEHISEVLSVERFLPAVGQGIVGITCREEDAETRALLESKLRDPDAWAAAVAERSFLRGTNGGCNAPIAGHATVDAGEVHLRGRVLSLDGTHVLEGEVHGHASDAEELGATLAEDLLSRGAGELVEQARRLSS